jgi:endonuclease/exonuclease/phosphatase family metal-dependent hydrolase
VIRRALHSQLPPGAADDSRLRVVTYNIHKGVRGMGLRKRLEIHNLGLGIEALDADLVFLQEVRLYNAPDARRFERTWFGWPAEGQAEFLAPEGYLAMRCCRAGRSATLATMTSATTASSSAACCMCRCSGMAPPCMRWWRTSG